ncbi:MAG: type I restriction endonuclease subunit R [Bacteroidales bacterium]|nr:type I restriction endonuclease subunit R [Bacteroidales bacterium]
MNTSTTNEQAFEALIEKALIGSTREERGTDANVDSQTPASNQYYWGQPKDMDKTLALDLRRLWSFLKTTQQNTLDSYRGRDLQTSLPKQLSKAIETQGVIDVIRKGLDVDNIHLTLFYPKPTAADSEESHRLYSLNQFSITRQQTFSNMRPGLELDMVLFLNGIPLFTFELKNPWTHQTARVNGQKQYKSVERDPKDTILRFGRCLAHFTLDKDEIYFTTHLALDKTYFMPFNKGLENGAGAGNPVNPNGFKTSYLWEEVLQKDMLSDIIMNYVLFDYGETKTQRKVPHIMKNANVLIFPRYHQLDVVNKLTEDVSTLGVGKTYLIQHSAGSGKSNSITWLAYKLIKECPATMDAVRAKSLDTPLYNSVIVVTDRRLLDKQITDNIKAFGQSDKIVAHADSSADLKSAIENNKRIIITTIQKFPFISDTIRDVSDHNFAILIDEAHSSQSGVAADKMNAAVQKVINEDGEVTTDAILMELMLSRKMSTNCSYFAFTATPKKETLERFGVHSGDGSFHPFHLYSMKQAIEEGFILDVLTNYTTYKSYYELIKSTEDNPFYESERAQKLLKKAVEREPKTIKAKAEQMLAHFDANIFRTHKLMGKAKAMVVTKDIECAIRYYGALQEIKKEKKLPFGIVIAFSGEKNVDGSDFTEASINGFPETKTAEEFDKDENRILVVANKYLTGFDQPKLAAMYIDKPLAGVLAVQALSRLNRANPSLGKRSEDLFILDFYNKIDDIKASFDPYYTSTALSEPTDVNVLHELRSTLLSVGVFDQEEVDEFSGLYFMGQPAEKWTPVVDVAAERFNDEIEWPENGQADFKIKCKQFVKVYSRVAAIIDYEVKEWEKLFWFLRFLIPGLHVDVAGRDDMKDLLDNVDLNTYGLRRTALNQTVKLDEAETVVDPNKAVMAGAGSDDVIEEALNQIIEEFNEHHFNGWEATPEDQKTKLISIATAIKTDSDYKNLVVGNPDPEAVETTLNGIIDRVIRMKRTGDMSLYKQYQQNEDFKAQMRRVLTRMINAIDSTPESTLIKGVGFTQQGQGSILGGSIAATK